MAIHTSEIRPFSVDPVPERRRDRHGPLHSRCTLVSFLLTSDEGERNLPLLNTTPLLPLLALTLQTTPKSYGRPPDESTWATSSIRGVHSRIRAVDTAAAKEVMNDLEPQSLSYAAEKEILYRREPNTRHHHHVHVHKLKPRQETTVEQVQAVTTVIQTLSYVQQFDVDSEGNVFSTQKILTNTPEGFTLPNTTAASPTTESIGDTASSAAPSSTASPVSPASSAQPDSSSQSLLPSSSTLPSLTSTPSIPATTDFPSISISSNATLSASTPLILSSSSSSLSFSNTTTSSSSSSRSSLTYLTSDSSSSSGTSTSSSNLSSTSSSTAEVTFSSTTSSPTGAVGGDGGGAVGGATGVAPSGASPSSTGAAGAGGGSSTPSTSVVVGSVVGSVAGVAFLLILLLLLAKWRKRKNMLSLGNGNDGGAEAAARELPPAAPTGGMTQRRSTTFAVPVALASLAAGFTKRSSQRSERTVSTAPSERGFYRVSGRKLPSVLQSGGDGYGGGAPDANTLSGSSFYRDSTGFYGGGGPSHGPSSPLASNTAAVPSERDSGVPVMRPSPARTPVTEQGPFRSLATPPPPLQPPRRHDLPDSVGRSHPSQDGSHASRFTEEV